MTLLMCTSSKCWLWIFSRQLQDQLQRAINNFPSNWLPFWKIRTIYCVLNILWSVLCIKIQLCDKSDEPSNALLCCTANVCLFCFCALKTVTSQTAGRELNMNVRGTHLLWHLCDLRYSYILLKCTVCILVTGSFHNVSTLCCMHIMFAICYTW